MFGDSYEVSAADSVDAVGAELVAGSDGSGGGGWAALAFSEDSGVGEYESVTGCDSY